MAILNGDVSTDHDVVTSGYVAVQIGANSKTQTPGQILTSNGYGYAPTWQTNIASLILPSFYSVFPSTGLAVGALDSTGTIMVPLNLDASGLLKVNVVAGGGGGGGSNAAAGLTGAAVPTSASYTGYNSGGNLLGVSVSNPLPVSQQGSVAVTGTFWQATQPVSGTVTTSPPANASTNVAQVGGTNVDTNSGNKSAGTLRVTLATDQVQLTNALKVDGSAVTQPVSAASLPLPTGASTAAKQPALGTAGAASADVLTVQGIASMTALKVDGSAVTQPVSGTVTTSPPANASTNVAQVGGTNVDTNSGNKSAGTLRVTLATDQVQLTNALKVDGSAVTQPVQIKPVTSGGTSYYSLIQPATAAKTSVKTSAGQLYHLIGFNTMATPVWVKLFDLTLANITFGTTDCTYQFMIPGNTSGAGFVIPLDLGIAFANAISYAVTGAIGTHDSTAITANAVVVNFGYA